MFSAIFFFIIKDVKMTFFFLLKGESGCNTMNEQRIKKPESALIAVLGEEAAAI